MNNRKASYGLVAFYVAAVFMVGCIPEESLEWSDDGSVGLLRAEGGLAVVDGKTGKLIATVGADIGLLPDISSDGSLIAYSERVECDSLPEALKLLPPGQAKVIEYYAAWTREYILAGRGVPEHDSPFQEEEAHLPEDYRSWAIRYLCENPESELREAVGQSAIENGKGEAISYWQVVVAPAKNPVEKRVLAVSIFPVMATQISPDHRSVAYLMHAQVGRAGKHHEEFGLYVASLEADVEAMLVESPVAFGYDWHSNSRKIAYLSADSEIVSDDDLVLGTLKEKIVAEADGTLLSEPVQVPEKGTPASHRCTGKETQFAGSVFYPWLKVAYGRDNRIFFSSCALPLPVSKREDPGCSLFCYDPLTATVTDVLPQSISSHTSQQILALSQFSLSPDGRQVLLPIEKNRFLVHALGSDSAEVPIPEEEGFGDEEFPEMAPSWKGNDEITFLVSADSHFLAEMKDAGNKPNSRELVVLKDADDKSWVLSAGWPYEMRMISERDN